MAWCFLLPDQGGAAALCPGIRSGCASRLAGSCRTISLKKWSWPMPH